MGSLLQKKFSFQAKLGFHASSIKFLILLNTSRVLKCKKQKVRQPPPPAVYRETFFCNVLFAYCSTKRIVLLCFCTQILNKLEFQNFELKFWIMLIFARLSYIKFWNGLFIYSNLCFQFKISRSAKLKYIWSFLFSPLSILGSYSVFTHFGNRISYLVTSE